MYETHKRGRGSVYNLRKLAGKSWRRSRRRVGGWWQASATLTASEDTDTLTEIFLNGLTREVRESVGSEITWQGFIGDMTLTLDGIQYQRSWGNIHNGKKVIYTRIGDNLFTNGSAESAAWAAHNTPETLEQSTVWVTDGVYSCHISTTTVGGDDGAIIQSPIAVVALKAYSITVAVNIVAGTWRMEVYRTDTNDNLCYTQENAVGDSVMRASIRDDNTYAGNVGVRLFCDTAPGEIYADGAVFQEAALRAETAWLRDTASETEWGTMEDIILAAGMSDAAANGLCATELFEYKHPRTQPPEAFASIDEEAVDQLDIVCYGYVFTTRNKYSLITGSAAANAHVTSLLAVCEFVAAGVVEVNAMSYQIDTRAPLRQWEILRDITLAGDTTGALWQCGCYNGDLKFHYEPFPTAHQTSYQHGKFINIVGGQMEPWYMEPGLVYLRDLPTGPDSISTFDLHDPHVIVAEEIEFSVADWLANGSGISLRCKVSDD